jgi:hypothetical protein
LCTITDNADILIAVNALGIFISFWLGMNK